MYLIDYHTHTQVSDDAEFPLSAMADAAVLAGISELCVTDHYDLLDLDGAPIETPYDWAPAVAQWEEEARHFQDRLTIRLGLEFGSAAFDQELSRRTLEHPAIDFVIGSIHNLTPEAGGTDFYFVDYKTPDICYACLDDYFANMLRLAPLPYYDVLGHIIYPLRYMNLRCGHNISLERYQDQLREILRLAAQNGRGMEINTYDGRTVSDWRPVLELFREVGGELVTVGSDAHTPQGVGKGVQAAYQLLSDVGFRYVTLYEKRQPQPIKL